VLCCAVWPAGVSSHRALVISQQLLTWQLHAAQEHPHCLITAKRDSASRSRWLLLEAAALTSHQQQQQAEVASAGLKQWWLLLSAWYELQQRGLQCPLKRCPAGQTAHRWPIVADHWGGGEWCWPWNQVGTRIETRSCDLGAQLVMMSCQQYGTSSEGSRVQCNVFC
jgi:hypothetical protein